MGVCGMCDCGLRVGGVCGCVSVVYVWVVVVCVIVACVWVVCVVVLVWHMCGWLWYV